LSRECALVFPLFLSSHELNWIISVQKIKSLLFSAPYKTQRPLKIIDLVRIRQQEQKKRNEDKTKHGVGRSKDYHTYCHLNVTF